ncbi:MAG TPA: DNA-3-methyladenine glycosylase [Candidatus Limnocylindria bacterium]|nr:DNA-3-methyladenine glycosylase [Candidatus Limnocylindria bacterium]
MTVAPAGEPDALEREWFDRGSAELAPELLGARLVHETEEGRVGGRIVEVEAYRGPEDLAAHSSRGRTPRNAVMFGPPGHLYVYLIYGLHHCLNVVAGPGEKPEAVLIRALHLDEGVELARRRRGEAVAEPRLAAGPGNVGSALGIDRGLNGVDLLRGPVRVEPRLGPRPRISRGPRIGVDYAGTWAARPLRFWITDDPHLSRR